MIRLLTEQDRDEVLNYLYQDSAFNIFPIGDIESFGFQENFQKVYAEFDELGNYMAVLLKYRDNGIYYTHLDYFNPEFFEVQPLSEFQHFSGKTEIMKWVNPYLYDFNRRQMYFCKANKLKVESLSDRSFFTKLETREQCEKLYDLLASIEEFGIYKRDKSEFVENHMKSTKMGVTMFITSEDKIISTVSTTAETTKNAMVVAVATDLNHRNQGYTTKLMTAVMEYYFKEKNKELCLFYDNPQAGKIYIRLGFEPIGKWDMYDKN
ncbi:MAG: GNAT family N-acetyltransferase [Bacilli bacterium]|nr:GNAT family N-acetyltransferase [Bacilli bacterium]MBN2876280.1 GNAT family N-acetyltransferase [Bacilli bacterium]